ncbi:glycosyltransferase family 32 protein [Flavobacterium commune]|uniref:Glycosyl transferase n=1 Tax=Flavobacterium commune TaxID=1306519 RepID=A0A1D9P7M8_9FLAO|nr:glycosyltransferase [Flavobacterium commune]AOZ98533.1 hypothetical protein BIW12_03290 [Flavobacterium commune]
MIPKIIHYFWFGVNAMPALAVTCIESWKKHLPDYEFKLWNEENFDVNVSPYCKQAYENKQYAFVSDYARFYVLAKHGGVYMDVDYEVVKPFDEIVLNNNVVMGLDEVGDLTAFMAARPKSDYILKMIDKYNSLQFINNDGSFNNATMNIWMEEVLSAYDFKKQNENQVLDSGIVLFKDDYFQAKSLLTGKFNVTENTYTIHHHTLTWVSTKTKIIKFIRMNVLIPVLGVSNYMKLVKYIKA